MAPDRAESGNNLRAAALYGDRFVRTASGVRENYCFKCGSYTEIDDLTRLCVRCYRAWGTRTPPRG